MYIYHQLVPQVRRLQANGKTTHIRELCADFRLRAALHDSHRSDEEDELVLITAIYSTRSALTPKGALGSALVLSRVP